MLASPVAGKIRTLLDREGKAPTKSLLRGQIKPTKETAAADEESARKKELEESMTGRRYERTWGVDPRSGYGRAAKEKPSIFSEVTTVIAKELKGTTGNASARDTSAAMFKSR